MKRLFKPLLLCALAAGPAITAQAASSDKPVFHKYTYSDNGIVQTMSDNGQWVLAGSGHEDTSGAATRLINMDTNEETVLSLGGGVSDISDDGNILAGSTSGTPAYYDREKQAWTKLPIPSDCSGGSINAMTPDGKYAVGTCTYLANEYWAKGAMWDLEADTMVALTNLPSLDMTHLDQHQQYLQDISADGRYLIGCLSYSYIYPASLCSFLYDVQTQSYKFLGFTPNDTAAWAPAADGIYFVENAHISPNGKWVACSAYMVKENEGSEWPSEYTTTAIYNVETGEFTVYDETESQDIIPFCVGDDGTVYGATPTTTPLREWSIRHNGYWYTIRQILSQNYGIDFDDRTGYENTGTPYAVSTDGTRFVCVPDPTCESYVLDLPKSASEVCDDIDLLSNYTLSPADGSTFSRITTVELTFDRDITVASSAKATLNGEDGSVIRSSLSFKVSVSSDKKAVIGFRGTNLEGGKKYTVEIPAGVISLAGDATKTNKAITISYNGRDNVPVGVTSAYPADSSELAKIDNSTTFPIIDYDVNVEQTDTAKAYLINTTVNDTVTALNIYIKDNQVALYPSSTQYLYSGQDYAVVLEAGSLTDVSGRGGNEKLTLNYTGTYVRELSHDDATLFFDDFSSVSQSLNTFMRYEGDHNTPTTEMQNMEFDADNQPWNFSIRDDGASDYCAGSTSMYTPAGQSDDWMVIPQIEIPDEYCTLTFLAQSYNSSKNDTLKVVVWENETNINYLTDDVMAQLKAGCEVVFNERLNPGLSDNELADDWTEYNIDLSKYAGKKIYIGFWNNNTNQSMIFVDSISVKRNLKYLISLTNQESVVDQDEIAIKGRLTVNSDLDTYTSVKLTLCGTDGNAIESIEQSGLSLKKGDTFDFSFTNPLPLTKGETNSFTIRVQLDDYYDVVTSTVKDLMFNPTKRVVLEEFTGTTCVNCPLGILAIENLEKMYGDQFIPVSIHTYDGDALGSGLSGYSSYLGLTAAPTGIINRSGTISSPMWQNPATFGYEFSNGSTLWADYVAQEMEVPADIDINASISIDLDNETFTIPVEIRSALNAKNQMLNLFMTVVEDGVSSYQTNTFCTTSDPNLGEWGKGGMYGQSTVYGVTHNDVARAVYGTTYAGTQGLLPQTLKAGETYTTTLTDLNIPLSINTLANCKAILMLIDANTEKVINAVSVKFSDDPTGISSASSAAPVATTFYDMTGRMVETPSNGIFIKRVTMADGTVKTSKIILK